MKVVLVIIIIASLAFLGAAAWGVSSLVSRIGQEAPVTPAPTPAPAPVVTTPPAPAIVVPPPVPAPTTPAIEQKIQDLQQVIADVQSTGKARETTVILTEAEVNQQAGLLVTQMQASPDAQLKPTAIRIDLKPGNTMLSDIDASVIGFKLTIKLKMQVGVANGKPTATITEMSFGSIPVPQSTKDQLAGTIAGSLDTLLIQMTQTGVGSGVNFEFKQITTSESDIAVLVLVKPA